MLCDFLSTDFIRGYSDLSSLGLGMAFIFIRADNLNKLYGSKDWNAILSMEKQAESYLLLRFFPHD